MDALADLLRAVRLTGGLFLEAQLSAPWCLNSRVVPEDCRPLLADPRQVIGYHYVLEGRLLAEVDGRPAIEVGPGQALILPRNDRHVLASGPKLRPVDADHLVVAGVNGGLARIHHGGGGPVTRIVCGYLGSDDERNPLIDTLPPLLTIDMAEAGDWVESSLRFAVQRLGSGEVATSPLMSRLCEMMLVEAVRRYAEQLPDDETGWLAGVRDAQVGRALALIHRDIAKPWTTDDLAREVAMSRSAFADRFTQLIGVPPKRYLTAWRMRTARDRLRFGREPVAEVAWAVGYEAEEAFTRAFKREFGLPPAAWRKAARPDEAAANA